MRETAGRSTAHFKKGGWIQQLAGRGCRKGLWTYYLKDGSVRDSYVFDETADPGGQGG